jgi:hypothetical protein
MSNIGIRTAADGLSGSITFGGVDVVGINSTGIISGANAPQIQPISASVAANALTITASALRLDFRSVTLSSGTVTTVSGTPASLVVPSGATLGTVNATQSNLVVLALNNAGTIELAVINIAGGADLTETGLITTTTISASATANGVAYSTTGRTSVPYRVIGYIESTQATAGTWATAPSKVQGCGGQALAAMGSLGYGQTWQDVKASRAFGVNYTNTTGRPICVSVTASSSSSGSSLTGWINGVTVTIASHETTTGTTMGITFIVPPGNTYQVTATGSVVPSLSSWLELR